MKECSNNYLVTIGQEWTIDELARHTGMTVRNIRAHQSRGLVAAPVVRGRTGYYGPEHAERIALIQELQSEGFNLEAIRRLADAVPGAEEQPLRFLRTVYAPYGSEKPQPVTAEQLVDDWGADAAPLLERAIELGLIRQLDDGTMQYPSPGLIRAAKEVVQLGIPLERQLDLVAAMREHLSGSPFSQKVRQRRAGRRSTTNLAG
jgi:DNA-binding transcriptional MerR regulator